MPGYNKVILMGNLTRDPELKYTASGTAVCQFGLAVNKKYKSGDMVKEDVCFVDITVWSKQGENCNTYLQKGSQALIEGELKLNSWQTQSGENRSKLTVTASSVTFLSSNQGDGNNVQQSRGNTQHRSTQSTGSTNETHFPDDDQIPF